MLVKDSKFLSKIPEVFVRPKSIDEQDRDKELVENIEPNLINTIVALLEKTISGLDEFNNWNNYDKYSSEFKLKIIFDKVFDKFSLRQVELLKGFFRFKGTYTDLIYIMKIAGYDVAASRVELGR